ncbi:MAG: glycosyltransferase family 4 protein [Muribaculaceae bacterium]|nr:glycosyltransferase family 4 protein [Muribaculaceae bacterium]
MKILLCSPLHTIGGISKWTKSILDGFNMSKDVELSLYAMDPIRYLGDNASTLTRVVWGVPSQLRNIWSFIKKFRAESPKIVHVCSSGSMGLIRDIIILRICRRAKVKSCLHLHYGRIPGVVVANGWEWSLLKQAVRLADCVVVMTSDSKAALESAGFDNVTYVPNPISEREIDYADSIPTAFSERKLIFAGHILETKGIRELLSAMESFEGLTLRLFGADSKGISTQLKQTYSRAFAKNDIEFVGQVDHATIIKEMKSGILILPSYTEGFPYVILEGMACGAPIIATTVGAIPEMLDFDLAEPCGVAIEARSVASLTQAIANLTATSDYCRIIGARAAKKVRCRYSTKQVCSLLTDTWKALLQ